MSEVDNSPTISLYDQNNFYNIEDQYNLDDIFLDEYNYRKKLKRCNNSKRICYLSFLLLSIFILFTMANQDMYNGDPKYSHQFNYGKKLLNIVVPNKDYYSKDDEINPMTLSIIWYNTNIVYILLSCCIHRIQPIF